jgi:lysophospholipase L1-like esterase
MRNAALALVVMSAVVVLSTRDVHEPPHAATSPNIASGGVASVAEAITPTSRAHRRHNGSVLLLGDSLTVGADKAGLTTSLKADGWTVDIDADEGRSTRGGILALQVHHPTVPELVVVELGTNPSAALATFPAEIETMLDELTTRGAKRVLWLTPHHRTDGRYDGKDAAIATAADKHPMLVMGDWHAFAVGHADWMRPDGLHYTDSGYRILAAFMADLIDANDPTP